MINEYIINNITSGGHQQIHLSYTILDINDIISCASKSEDIRRLCKQGCINYGKKWSCPPYSQNLNKIISNKFYSYGIVLVGYINLEDMKYIKKTYQQIKAANIILKSKIEKYTRKIEELLNGYAFLSGSCNLCKPCKKKLNLSCKKPHMRRYSLE